MSKTPLPSFKIHDEVQRVGWQPSMIGTVLDYKEVRGKWLYYIQWPFRGLADDDRTTAWEDDLAPPINWTVPEKRA